ncbi:hypothetical protein Tco_0917064 [Tanacetum coccineum]
MIRAKLEVNTARLKKLVLLAEVSTASRVSTASILFEGVTDWYQSQGYRESAVMSSASSAVTYTFVYTDSEPGRAFWGADDEEIPEGGIPRVIVLEYVGLSLQPRSPTINDITTRPEVDEHEFLAVGARHLPPVDSPTAESPGYVTESDPEEDPEEYEDDETEGCLDDDEERDRSISFRDSNIVVPVDELIFPPEGTEPVIPPPSTKITIRARITVRPQTSISLPPEAEIERLLAMTTPSPSPPISLSPPLQGELPYSDYEQPTSQEVMFVHSRLPDIWLDVSSTTRSYQTVEVIRLWVGSTVDAEERDRGLAILGTVLGITGVVPAEGRA